MRLPTLTTARMRCGWVVLVLAVVASFTAITLHDARPLAAQDTPVRGASLGNPRRTQTVDVVDKIKACVVNIHSERTVSDARDKDKFNDVAQTQHRVNGMGTGIVIDPRGYLITNYHVIEDVHLLRVRLCDGTTLPAKIIARDPESDLAILKVDPPKPLPTIPLGTSSDLMLAEPVIAIGNAFGYEHTVTTGIVSAMNRDVALNKEISYKSLIQTSAGINPGNSGGPLLNVHGELIGVNVAIRAGAQNIAFALPIDNVLKTVAAMLSVHRRTGQSHGLVVRDIVDAKENPVKRSVIVERVESGSAADAAGFKPGDIVTSINNVPVKCAMDIERAFLEQPAGLKVNALAVRGNEEMKAELTLKAQGRAVAAIPVAAEGDTIWKTLGVKVEAVAAETVVKVNKDLRGGLLITEVRPDSLAAKAGFQRGDILLGLHQYETITPANITWVMTNPNVASFSPLRYFLMRGNNLRRGWLPSE